MQLEYELRVKVLNNEPIFSHFFDSRQWYWNGRKWETVLFVRKNKKKGAKVDKIIFDIKGCEEKLNQFKKEYFL